MYCWKVDLVFAHLHLVLPCSVSTCVVVCIKSCQVLATFEYLHSWCDTCAGKSSKKSVVFHVLKILGHQAIAQMMLASYVLLLVGCGTSALACCLLLFSTHMPLEIQCKNSIIGNSVVHLHSPCVPTQFPHVSVPAIPPPLQFLAFPLHVEQGEMGELHLQSPTAPPAFPLCLLAPANSTMSDSP